MVEDHHNTALADEIEAINSIYGQGTIQLTTPVHDLLAAILQLPNTQFSFTLTFEPTYPDSEPRIQGVHSVAEGAKGVGKATEGLLARTLQRVWIPGQVCLFDLVEEARPAIEHPQEEDDGNDAKEEAKAKAGAEFAREVTAVKSRDDPFLTMYAALIRTHHITSRKKVATLKAAAKQIGCAALLRSGGTPGVMYVESKHMENVKKWVDTVHDLRYKDYQLVSPPAVVPGRPFVSSTEESFHFEEVGSVKDFGARMEEKGIIDWWRKAMGYVSE